MQASLDFSRVALRTRFHQRPGEADRFDLLTPEAIRGFIDNLLSMVAAVVVPVTLISLVVGGIVIMNIMLVSAKPLSFRNTPADFPPHPPQGAPGSIKHKGKANPKEKSGVFCVFWEVL